MENNWAKDYSYNEDTFPVLDSFVDRAVLFCIATKLSVKQKSVRQKHSERLANQ